MGEIDRPEQHQRSSPPVMEIRFVPPGAEHRSGDPISLENSAVVFRPGATLRVDAESILPPGLRLNTEVGVVVRKDATGTGFDVDAQVHGDVLYGAGDTVGGALQDVAHVAFAGYREDLETPGFTPPPERAVLYEHLAEILDME